ncbi:MAG: 1-(5-phosphoribosyl)-5-[(5-phosphoribosylamino)methylideneamino] imidazole-4-carboxamide isomerase [Bacteroidota bacterium]|nr:1-(5-phosphoribosyl)-5-[(5-phosphoribosylamino)methylideneamino] imidazole-4-carboxamide isomerase [Bacteroidota bacterium]
MILIIPSIEIKNGRCAIDIEGTNGFTYSKVPIEIAKLWRKENAKSIHVTDLDGVKQGRPVNFGIITQILKSVDIPIELGGGLRTFQNVKDAFKNGIYRVVIGTMFIENPDEAKRSLDVYGPNKIALAIDVNNYHITVKGGEDGGISPLSAALNAYQLGFQRVIYTDILTDGAARMPNFKAVELLAKNSNLRITVSGGIGGLDHLLKLQELEPFGVDSVIIGRALYENRFPCQQLWRMCEAGNYPYTAKI